MARIVISILHLYIDGDQLLTLVSLNRVCLAASIVVVALQPAQARACQELCFQWDVVADDTSELETLEVEEPYPARGAHVRLFRPPPEYPLDVYLDTDGCMTFETEFTSGFHALVMSEARLGQAQDLYIRSREDVGAGWAVSETPVVIGSLADDVLIPYRETHNLLAWSAHTIYRATNLSDECRVPNREYVLRVVTGDDEKEILGTSANVSEIGSAFVDKKYAIAHETGHWLHKDYFDAPYNCIDGCYEHPSQSPLCTFDDPDVMIGGESHVLRSSEWGPAAYIEGVANFFASVAFNERQHEGAFRYYKVLAGGEKSDDLVSGMYLVSLAGGEGDEVAGGENAWVFNMCSQDWMISPDEAEISNELDWMRYLWAMWTVESDSYGAPPSMDDLMLLLRTLTVGAPQWYTNTGAPVEPGGLGWSGAIRRVVGADGPFADARYETRATTLGDTDHYGVLRP